MSGSVAEENKNLSCNITGTPEEYEKVKNDCITRIDKFYGTVRGGEIYFEKVKSLGLVNQERFLYLLNLMIQLDIQSENKWDIKDVYEDLLLLTVLYSERFYNENLFTLVTLDEIKFLSENLYRLTHFLFSDGLGELNLYLEATPMFKKIHPKIFEYMKTVSNEFKKITLIKLKNDLYQVLIQILSLLNFYSQFNKEVTTTETEEYSSEPFSI